MKRKNLLISIKIIKPKLVQLNFTKQIILSLNKSHIVLFQNHIALMPLLSIMFTLNLRDFKQKITASQMVTPPFSAKFTDFSLPLVHAPMALKNQNTTLSLVPSNQLFIEFYMKPICDESEKPFVIYRYTRTILCMVYCRGRFCGRLILPIFHTSQFFSIIQFPLALLLKGEFLSNKLYMRESC